MNPSFDTQPASFLQQFNAWKEQVVRYEQLSGENLPDFIKLTAVVNGLKGNVRQFVLLSLDGESSFGDLDSFPGKYFNNTYVQSESTLNSVWDKARRDKQKGKSKGKGKKPNPYYKQKFDKGGKGKGKGKGKEGKGKGKGKQAKGKGEAFPPQSPANKGKGKQQLPKREQWCNICWKKGHSTQACWWNTDTTQQQRQQRQQEQAWYYTCHQQQGSAQPQSTAQASMQRQQPQVLQHRPADNLRQLDSR